ncbi:MFS transporter [Breoghania sp.]|uniref:MFS transporter n=1 Tax=Breoghania sp. TaxID=2065378 RepID=UPI00262390D9|nr:MFS transporter [Breoghania sp.]MDJ0932365.1 MFS transporter [Breoghania sp.]
MAKTLNPIAALLLSVALTLLRHGLQATLLPVHADMEGFSAIAIGWMSSSYFAGLVLGCVVAPYAVLRAGHIHAFATLVSLGSASAILYPALADPIAWAVIRFAYGFTIAGFYLIVESWLNEHATNENRDALMSTYIIINLAAITGGQLLLTVIDPEGFTAFVLASVAVSLAVVPISMTRSQQPAPITFVHSRPMELYQISPAAIVGSLFIRLANGTNWTLAPLYARQVDLDKAGVAYFASAIIFSGALAQWPIGRLSDRMDRRYVLIGLACASGIVATLITELEPTQALPTIAFAGLLGFVSQPAYSIAVAHAFDHVESESFVETSSGLLLANGIGSTIGLLVASVVMMRVGPSGLYATIAVMMFSLAAYIIFRIQVRERPSARLHTEFDLAGTAQVGGVLTPELLDKSSPHVVVPEYSPVPHVTPDPEAIAEAWETAWDGEEETTDETASSAAEESGKDDASPAAADGPNEPSSDGAKAADKDDTSR